jgi:urease subunit alpha
MAPRILEALLAAGLTTVLGQEFGPVWGTGVNSPWALRILLAAFDAWPVNIGVLARGSSSRPEPLVEALVHGGACGFKVHEDTGSHRRALDTALQVADEHDVQVALHTDGLNESLCVDDTLDVIAGRSVHVFHVEGCGGGHAPDALSLAGVSNIITSSTNPTVPYGRDAVAEHYDMIIASHGLSRAMPTDNAIVRDRIRPSTMGAEDVLHDLGVIPIMSSDAQGMGRASETVRRTFALAAKMKAERGAENPHHDNERVLRYLAKLTVNPAVAHGLAREVGSLRPGMLADIVLWRPAMFAAKPQLVLKSGFPAWGCVGDPNATVEGAQPTVLGPQFGAFGGAPAELAVAFVSRAAHDAGEDRLPTRRRRVAVRDARGIGLADMVKNSRHGRVVVDSVTGSVELDGIPLRSEPLDCVALSRRYFL